MRRSLLPALAILVATSVGGAMFLLPGQARDRAGTPRPPVARRVTARAHAETPRPPMNGRVAILPDQLREAYAAGLIDRPIKSLLDVPSRMTYGDFVWNDRGVPAGPVWIRVELKSQILSVFRAG